MYLARIVYTSTVTEGFNVNDIETILETARKNNTKENITGMLCFNSQYFLQCLEGSRKRINKVYHKILNDERHKDIIMLDYKEISMREFSQWSMGYLPESSLTAPLNIRYSGTREFTPYEMSGESAHKMMIELRDIVPTV